MAPSRDACHGAQPRRRRSSPLPTAPGQRAGGARRRDRVLRRGELIRPPWRTSPTPKRLTRIAVVTFSPAMAATSATASATVRAPRWSLARATAKPPDLVPGRLAWHHETDRLDPERREFRRELCDAVPGLRQIAAGPVRVQSSSPRAMRPRRVRQRSGCDARPGGVRHPACGSARGGAGVSTTGNDAGRASHQTAAAGSASAQPRSRPTCGSKP